MSADKVKAIRCCWPNNINGDSDIKYCGLGGGSIYRLCFFYLMTAYLNPQTVEKLFDTFLPTTFMWSVIFGT